MADKYENEINRFADQQNIAKEEAKKASSFSDRIDRAKRAGLKIANSEYRQVGTNTPYRGRKSASVENYISDADARSIISGKRNSTSHGIWKQVNSPNWMGNRVQDTIEQILNLRDGDVLLGLDIETLGTAGAQGGVGNFGATQIAAVPYKVDFNNADGPLVKIPGDEVNILTRPDEKTMDWLATAIDKLDKPGMVPDLTAEEYRSLKDLVALAGDARFGDAAGVILKTNTKAISDGANLKNYKQQIREGYRRLKEKTLSITEGFDRLNRQIFNGGYKLGNNFKYLTTNGTDFDIPALQELTNNMMPAGNGHIDFLQAMRITHGDVFTDFYKSKGKERVRGLMQLDSIFQATFGMDMHEAGLRPHYAYDDTLGLGMVGNKLLPDIISRVRAGRRTGRHDIMGRYGKTMATSAEYQTGLMENGMTLFGRSTAYKGSALDSVIDLNNPTAMVRKVGPSIYKNRRYKLVDQFMQDGNYSVLLHNLDDDVYHLIGRKSKEELQSVMQRSFVPFSSKMKGYSEIKAYSVYDAARREYESMFVGDGSFWKADKYMKVVDAIEKGSGGRKLSSLSQEEFDTLLKGNSFGLSRTQKRHMQQFYKRLGAEAPTIKDFISEVKKAGLVGQNADLAMENFRESLDSVGMSPTKSLKLPSMMNQVELFAPAPKGGALRGVDATNFGTLEAGIRSLLTGGVKDSNMNFANVVDNFNQVVSDLVYRGVIGKDEGKNLIYDGSRFLATGNSKTGGVTYLSSLLASNVGNKLKRVDAIERVADLSATSHMVSGLANQSGLFSSAIDSAKNMITYSNKGLALADDAKSFIDASHIQKALSMQRGLGLPSTKMPLPPSTELEAFASALAEQGVYMSAYVNNKNSRGLTLALYAKEHANDVLRKGVKSPYAATVYIPLAENDMLVTNGVAKANIAYAIMGKEGNTWISTAQNQVMFKLKNTKQSVIDAFKMGNIGEASRVMKRAVNRALNPLSSVSRYTDVADELDFSSKAANWLRTNLVNVTPLANGVLGQYGKSWDDLTLSETNNLIRDILHGTPGNYLTDYGAKIQGELQGLHLQLGLSSTKTELAAKGMFGRADARWLMPFGTYSTATREFNWQAQNYFALDPNRVDKSRINPIIMTDVGQQVYEGEVTGIMVKTANVDDIKLRKLFGDKWESMGISERPSTYESQVVMRESVAKQLGVYNRKKLRIDPGSGLEYQEGLLTAIQKNGFYSLRPGETITLGKVMKDNNGNPIDTAAHPLQYKSKYGSVIRGVNQLENGGYEFDIDEFMPSERGFKIISEAGDKGTVNIIPDAVWDTFPEEVKRAEMLKSGATYGSAKRPPSMTIMEELDYAVAEYLDKNVTVGKMSRQEAESHVVDVISNMLGTKEGIGYRDYNMVHGTERVLTIPGMSSFKNITFRDLDTAVNALGVKQGSIRYGLSQIRRSIVEEYPEFMGSKRSRYSSFEGIQWGMREMEMMESRAARYRLTGGPDISPLINRLKDNALGLSAENIRENRGIWNVISDAMHGGLKGDYNVYTPDDLGSIKQIPTRDGGYLSSDFAGTILDRELAGGKEGFILKLPETFKVGKNTYVNQLFMPALRLENKMGPDGLIQLGGIQGYQRGIYNAIQQYRKGLSEGDKGLADDAYRTMEDLIPKYIMQAQEDVLGSQGSLVRNTLQGRLAHSGRTIAQAYNVGDLFDASGNVLKDKILEREGRVTLSRANMKTILGGVDESSLRELIGLAGGDASSVGKGSKAAMEGLLDALSSSNSKGLYGLIQRNPTIGEGSVLAARYFVDNELSSRTAMLTVGLATSLGADNDGDYISHIFPWLGGKKAKVLDRAAYESLGQIEAVERPMLAEQAEDALAKYADDLGSDKYLDLKKIAEKAHLGGIDDAIRSQFGDEMADRLITEARIGKTVGPFSNISSILRREATTVGSVTKNSMVYTVLSAFSEQVEQMPISSKKLEELLGRSGASGDTMERLGQFTGAIERLRSTDMYNMDIDSMIQDAYTIGILDKKDGTISGRYGIQTKYKIGHRATEQDVREALQNIKDYFPNGTQDTQARALSSKPYDVDKGFEMAAAIEDDRRAVDLPNIRYLREAIGSPLDDAMADGNLARRMLKNTTKVGGVTNEIPVSEVIGAVEETVGKSVTDGVENSVARILGKTKLGGGAAVALAAVGAWALSGMVRGGPRAEQQPAEGHEDQAPSSDGSYVNPAVYAPGAPAGAGPTAYVSARGSGYERVNVNIRGNTTQGMSNDQISQLISDEIRRQSGMDVNLRITSEDNRQTIDRQWLQTQFASALKTGYVY